MQSMTSQSVKVVKQLTDLLDSTNSLLKDLEDIADVFDDYKGLPQDFTQEGKKLTELANGSARPREQDARRYSRRCASRSIP